jgi:hypothetical protein
MNEKLTQEIERVLESSDIVWGQYGADTIRALAERIVKKTEQTLEEQRAEKRLY